MELFLMYQIKTSLQTVCIPVWENVDVFEKIDLESQLTGYSSAGCITYVELDSGVKK